MNLLVGSLPSKVPQILINREPLRHMKFDVELLGDGDTIINELCHRLGSDWSDMCTSVKPCKQVCREELHTPPQSPQMVSSCVMNLMFH